MARHQHRFVAIPITGQNVWSGKEALFGYHLECEYCYKQARTGDVIVEVKPSWWKEIIPKSIPINYVVTEEG